MQYLFDDSGRRYLDAYNNVPHVGHCHPRVVAGGRASRCACSTPTRDICTTASPRTPSGSTATLPAPLRVCYFVNSGSEANELALRLARAHTRRRDMIVLDAAYHGNTTTLIDISPYKHAGPGGTGAPAGCTSLPLPDVYRGAYRRDDPRAGAKYARRCDACIDELAAATAASRRSSPKRARASAGRSCCRPGISRTSTRTCAPPAACASPTKCRPGSAASGTHF